MLLSSFYAPWTQSERFSDIFMGYRKKTVSWNGLFSVKTDQFQRYDFCYSSLPYNHKRKNCVWPILLFSRTVIGIGVEDEDRKHTWIEDAESVRLTSCKFYS